MLFFPSLTIKAINSIAQIFLIFSLLIHTNQAGVIKKRDLSEVETTTSSTRLLQNEADFKERKVAPTILTHLTNDSATTKLKLQPVTSNFDFEHSMEFSNNEILLHEALKQQELKSLNQNISANAKTNEKFNKSTLNEENSKLSSSREIESEIKSEGEEIKKESTTEIKSQPKSESVEKNLVSSTEGIIVKEVDKVKNNINEKLEILNPVITTTEFSSNAIKEEKFQKNIKLETETEKKLENTKLTDIFKQLEISTSETTQDNAEEHEKHNENSESWENSLNTHERNPRPHSQILTELKLETETTTLKYENDIETNKKSKDLNEHLEDQLMQETTETKQVVITEIPMEERERLTTSELSNLNTRNSNELKTEETKAEIFSHDSENKQNLNVLNQTLAATTIKPEIEETLKSSQDSLKPLTNSASNFSYKEHLNTIHDGLDREVLLEVTTTFPLNEQKSTLLDGNKMEYARSMFSENVNEELKEVNTTLPVRADNEIFITTTAKPVVLSIKEGLKETTKGNSEESLSESSQENFTDQQSITEGLKATAKEDLKESLRESNKESFTDYQSITDGLKEAAKESSEGSLKKINKESVTEHQSITQGLNDTAKENLEMNLRDGNKESVTEPVLEGLKENNKNEVKDSLKVSTKDNINNVISVKEFNDLHPFVSEKKPKFINDNSTNAQQMNLPNNAEVWYLAAMKSLPKANVTIDTAPNHNNSTELKEEQLQNNNTYSLNTNSEKNLLDWSLIMQNKELATTARNQNLQQKTEDEEEDTGNQLTNDEKVISTTDEVLEKGKFSETPQQSVTQPSIQSREDMKNIKPLIEDEQVLEITTIKPNYTILSSYTTDNTDTDTNIRPIEMITSLTELKNNTTTTPSTLNHQTSVDVEPNLNEINLTSNQTQPHVNYELNPTTTTGSTNNVDVNVDGNVAVAATTTTTERALVTSTESTAGNNNDMTTLEQNSIELTTLSSLESFKQNASQNNNANVIEQQQYNNVLSEESTQKEFEKTDKETGNILQRNNFQNIELVTEITTTTSEIPITTFRPIHLAITSTTTTIPPSFRQEVDQNGNEIEQKQSIIALKDNRNNSKTIETHLSELENIETTTTTLETTKTSKKPLVEENTTSSSKDDEIIHEQIQKIDETKTTTPTTQTTPKLEEDVTTIGSPVIETKFEKAQEIETTTLTFKTPVVNEKQGVNDNESSTIKTSTEEDTTETQTKKEPEKEQEKVTEKPVHTDTNNELTTMGTYPLNTTTTTKEDEETLIKLLDDTTTTTSTTTLSPPTTLASQTTKFSSESSESESSSTTTSPLPITTKIEEIYKVIHTSTTEAIQTTSSHILTETTIDEELSFNTNNNNMIPTTTTPASTKMIDTNDIGKSLPTLTSIMTGNSGNMYPKNTDGSGETDVNVIIAITVSVIGVVALILLVGFLYIMRKRQKQTSFSNRCRPVSLDEYTIDNGSIGGSIRKSSALRSSKRTYGNLAFDDPSLRHNAMGVHELAKFVQEKLRIFEEFRDVPQITSRLDEVPQGCEDKNRYANVLPLPETRVILQRLNDDDKTEYINANYVTGPKDPPNYYIACQAPLDTTVEDFWRMIWEQQSRVIIQATDLIENGVEKCAEYLPPSVTLDNHSTFGDFQITLQNREVKDKYAISTILLKHVAENVTRELTHYWYKWPEVGVPAEEAPIIAMLLEARSSLISYAIEQANEDKEKSSLATLKSAEEGTANGTSPSKDSNGSSGNGSNGEINGNISMMPIKKTARNQGPLTIHCSPGTGRTGTIIACDIAIRSLETPKRTVDIPQIVFYVRRGRASAVLTKEQYEFIYKVANMYAAKISNPTNFN